MSLNEKTHLSHSFCSTKHEHVLLTRAELTLFEQLHSGALSNHCTNARETLGTFVYEHPWVESYQPHVYSMKLAQTNIPDELASLRIQHEHDSKAIKAYNERLRIDKKSVLPFVHNQRMYEQLDDSGSGTIIRLPEGTLTLPKSYEERRLHTFWLKDVENLPEYKEAEKLYETYHRFLSRKVHAEKCYDMALSLQSMAVLSSSTIELTTTQNMRLRFAFLLKCLLSVDTTAQKRPRDLALLSTTTNKIPTWVIPSPTLFTETGLYYHVHRIESPNTHSEFRESFRPLRQEHAYKHTPRPFGSPQSLFVFFT